MKIIGVIPSRYASSRFPGKPLVDIKGKTMIQRVYERASLCPELVKVIVATDDEKIYNHVIQFGGNVEMTSPEHKSGTDRCNEVLLKQQEEIDVVINIQGDEPIILPEQISLVARLFEDQEVQIGSLTKKAATDNIDDPNTIKVVFDKYFNALYFSRAPIPFNRKLNAGDPDFYKHIGIYGYRAETLKSIALLPQGKLEITESLEQLRWLENGYRIRLSITKDDAISVDTEEDLEAILNLYADKLQ